MYNELVEKLSFKDLAFFVDVELPKINYSMVSCENFISRFLVNPDIKDFLIEYMWEVNAPDLYIDLIKDIPISSRHMKKAYDMIDQEGIFYIVLPSGAVVSWI